LNNTALFMTMVSMFKNYCSR